MLVTDRRFASTGVLLVLMASTVIVFGSSLYKFMVTGIRGLSTDMEADLKDTTARQ